MVRHPIWLSLAFFSYSVFVAMQGQWQAGDIVWSMWIASLVGGYAYIVLSIFSGVEPSLKSARKNLFLLFFFTAHFGGFHFVHGQIMQGFFPLAEHDVSFFEAIYLTIQKYWQFVLVALANLWPQFASLLNDTTEEDRRLEIMQGAANGSMQGSGQGAAVNGLEQPLVQSAAPTVKTKRSHFQEPYRAVVRNHIMILVVAFASQLVAQPQLLYLLLVFYFFPFSDFLAIFKKMNRKNQE